MPFLGEFAALATAIIWSATSIIFTEVTKKIDAIVTNLVRLILAALFLGVTVFLFGLDMNLTSSQYLNLIISGVLGLTLGDTFLMLAFQKIGARISMLIMALAPAIAAFLAFIFLKEILSIWAILGIIITLTGVAVVILQRENRNGVVKKICISGILFGLLGAAGQATGLIFAKMAFNESEINGFVATFVRIATAAVPLYFIAMRRKNFINPVKLFLTARNIFGRIAVGAFLSSYFGITLSLIAIAYAYVGIASTIMATAPIIMLPMVKFYYKEELSWKSVIGAFVAVIGVAILFMK